MKAIESDGMPRANGHYSQCIEHNGLLYLSGQLPLDRETREIPETIEGQALLTLQNVESVLLAAGVNRNNILQMRVYISDISLWGQVNDVYAEFFGSHKPVRSIVPVKDLHFGASIEIEAIAVRELS